MDNKSLCNKCGLLPQRPVKPCPQSCGCKPKRRLCKPKVCCNKLEVYTVPAALGDDVTGEMAAKEGLFENMVVSYEANGVKYIYDSNGAYMKL